jgi:hypothetical protein
MRVVLQIAPSCEHYRLILLERRVEGVIAEQRRLKARESNAVMMGGPFIIFQNPQDTS